MERSKCCHVMLDKIFRNRNPCDWRLDLSNLVKIQDPSKQANLADLAGSAVGIWSDWNFSQTFETRNTVVQNRESR
jgi:hypothetical protein